MADTQLARIVAPAINDPSYVDSLNTAFDTINENFKKIASLPFLQGVQGDSYKIITKAIWTDSWNLTEDGALLLNCIFGTSFEAGYTFSACKDALPTLNSVSPLNFWGEGKQNETPNNNYLYFQVIIDDSGEEVPESKTAGQFYYFVDARLKVVGEAYHGNALANYTDYSGFFQYIPAHEEGGAEISARYVRAELLPTIYYDSTRNDICWRFNGINTGLSAIGVSGSDGINASISYVKCDISDPSQKRSAEITGVFNSDVPGSGNDDDSWVVPAEAPDKIHEGFGLICFVSTLSSGAQRASAQNPHVFAFGEIKKEDKWMAYWNVDSIIDDIVSFFTINSYFDNLGLNGLSNSASAIKFPMIGDGNRGDNQDFKHTIGTAYKDGDYTPKHMLIRAIQKDEESWKRHTGSQIDIDNYTIHLQPYQWNGDNTWVGSPDNSKGSMNLTNEGITISNSSGYNKTTITPDTATFGGTVDITKNLSVSGASNFKGDVTIGDPNAKKNLTIHGNETLNGNIVVIGTSDFKDPVTCEKTIDVKGQTNLWDYINLKSVSGTGKIFKGILVEKQGTRERHFDIVSDIVGVAKGTWGDGGAYFTVDGEIVAENGSLKAKNDLTFINSRTGGQKWHRIAVEGTQSNAQSNKTELSIESNYVSISEGNNSDSSNDSALLRVRGSIAATKGATLKETSHIDNIDSLNILRFTTDPSWAVMGNPTAGYTTGNTSTNITWEEFKGNTFTKKDSDKCRTGKLMVKLNKHAQSGTGESHFINIGKGPTNSIFKIYVAVHNTGSYELNNIVLKIGDYRIRQFDVPGNAGDFAEEMIVATDSVGNGFLLGVPTFYMKNNNIHVQD